MVLCCVVSCCQAVGRLLPNVAKVIVTKQRTEILPLIGAAVAAHPGMPLPPRACVASSTAVAVVVSTTPSSAPVGCIASPRWSLCVDVCSVVDGVGCCYTRVDAATPSPVPVCPIVVGVSSALNRVSS